MSQRPLLSAPRNAKRSIARQVRSLGLCLALVPLSCASNISWPLSSARDVVADGERVQRTYKFKGSFDEVDVSHQFDVKIKPGSERTVELSARRSILDYLVIDVKNDRLLITVKPGVSLRRAKPHVVVTMPDLTRIHASGSRRVRSAIPLSRQAELQTSGATLEQSRITGAAQLEAQ